MESCLLHYPPHIFAHPINPASVFPAPSTILHIEPCLLHYPPHSFAHPMNPASVFHAQFRTLEHPCHTFLLASLATTTLLNIHSPLHAEFSPAQFSHITLIRLQSPLQFSHIRSSLPPPPPHPPSHHSLNSLGPSFSRSGALLPILIMFDAFRLPSSPYCCRPTLFRSSSDSYHLSSPNVAYLLIFFQFSFCNHDLHCRWLSQGPGEAFLHLLLAFMEQCSQEKKQGTGQKKCGKGMREEGQRGSVGRGGEMKAGHDMCKLPFVNCASVTTSELHWVTDPWVSEEPHLGRSQLVPTQEEACARACPQPCQLAR